MKFDNCLVAHGNNPCNCGTTYADLRISYKQTIDDLRNQQLDNIRLMQRGNLKMTTEHEETEKLRPCPLHGDLSAMRFAGASSLYACCDKCTTDVVHYRPVEQWNSAYAWKLLDEKTETIRSQDEKIKELENAIKRWKEEEIIWKETEVEQYEKIKTLTVENQEQARLLGISGSREAKLLSDIRRLRGALESISRNTCCDNCQEAAKWAKAALQETAVFEAESTNPENRESDKTEERACNHCKGLIAIRMPVPSSGCDHLYYPENCETCKTEQTGGI